MDWENPEQTIFRISAIGVWTLDEYYERFIAAKAVVEAVEHPVVMISDLSQSEGLPPNFYRVGDFMRNHRITNLHFTIVVNNSLFYTFVIRTLNALIPKSRERMAVTTSLEAARRLAAEKAQPLR
jgi:hypothetical protein